MGIIISYSVRVKLNCGTLGGELVTDVPFKLMHPAPSMSLKNILTSLLYEILLLSLNKKFNSEYKGFKNQKFQIFNLD